VRVLAIVLDSLLHPYDVSGLNYLGRAENSVVEVAAPSYSTSHIRSSRQLSAQDAILTNRPLFEYDHLTFQLLRQLAYVNQERSGISNVLVSVLLGHVHKWISYTQSKRGFLLALGNSDIRFKYLVAFLEKVCTYFFLSLFFLYTDRYSTFVCVCMLGFLVASESWGDLP
jgi:hypothetical protein